MGASMPDAIEPQEEGVAVADLGAYLRGTWDLERKLEDRRTGTQGRLKGRAIIAPETSGLRYREEGALTFGDYRGTFFRIYLYHLLCPARAEVAFADGRPFHDLDLSRGTWRASHCCGDDLYEGRFTALHPDVWQAVWRVTGPGKELVLSGRFRRLRERA